MTKNRPDSLIFDMDGTLWNATDSYAKAWNTTFERIGMDMRMTNERLNGMMGWERRKILNTLFPEKTETEQDFIINHVVKLQDEIMPVNGGPLYEGVLEGLLQLSEKYKLFIVSNCAVNTIKQMMHYTGIAHLITDELAHGVNEMPKHHNINLIIQKHDLVNPVYIGDTESDGQQSIMAKVPFAFVSYGFGKTETFDMKFDSFAELTAYFTGLN